MKEKTLHVIAAAALAMGGLPPAMAQAPTAEDFSKHTQISDIALSPAGDKIAMAVPTADGTETQIWVVALDEKGTTQKAHFGKRTHVTDIVWTDASRLIVSKAEMEPLRALPRSTGELFVTDADGKNSDMLFGYVLDGTRRGRRKDDGFASVSQQVENQPGVVLIAFRSYASGENPATALFRVDSHSGERHEIERFPGNTIFRADHNGVPRIAIGVDKEDNPVLRYRAKADSDWQPVPAALAGYDMTPLRFATNNNDLYALVSDSREPMQLYRLDLAAGTRTRLAGRSDTEVSDVIYEGHAGPPVGVMYLSGKPAVDYFDKSSSWSNLHAGLLQRFAGELVRFAGISRDDRKILLYVYSDRHAGAYYIFDRNTNNIALVNELAPWLKPEQMAPVRSIDINARDGTKLSAFYTASGASTRPLVVMPHGGPYGINDSWEFDSDAQFLANRGYGVLQVNFRGSGGRGQSFIEKGYREWGGKIQDDIADSVRWAIDNKLVDAGKICIYGASFGGYAALMNPIRYPDLYRCAIGYAGVYDLALMFQAGDIHQSKSGKRYLERVLGTDPDVLAANSPSKQAAKLKLPILLAQGTVDRRVPMDQFDALVKAMRANGATIETLVVPGEAHGFYKPENRARMYNEMAAFLDKYLTRSK